MFDEINRFKKGTYSFERKLSKNNTHSIETLERKNYWKDFLGEGTIPFMQYITEKIGYTDDKILSLLSENDFDINETNELFNWKKLICDLQNKKFSYVELPRILWKNQNDQWDKDPAFLTFFKPFLKVAISYLRDNITERGLSISDKVEKQMLTILLNQLMSLGYRTLILELNIAREELLLKGNSSKEKYEYFNNVYLEKYFWNILEEYPVLFRIISVYINNWKDNMINLLSDYYQDASIIAKELNTYGEIVSIEGGLSDSHNKGKSVIILTIGDGNKIVYKPRSLEVDELFQNFLKWFNSYTSQNLYITKLINKGNHGWVEYISYDYCLNEFQLKSFYNELGSILCILYIFRANDVHYENIIAHASHPVLIDIETLFHNILVPIDNKTAEEEIIQLLERSVRRVGILPTMVWGKKGQRGVDISAIGGFENQEVPIESVSITNYFSDEMKIDYKTYNLQAARNIPYISDKKVDLSKYISEINVGFEKTYELLSDEAIRKNLINEILKFNGKNSRCITRATQFYSSLLRISYHPDFLRSGLDREMLFSRLWKQANGVKQFAQITPFEIEDLLNGDVPIFLANINNRNLSNYRGQIIKNMFEKSGIDLVLEQINLLGRNDFDYQKSFIDISLSYDPEYNLAKPQPNIELRVKKFNFDDEHNLKEKYLQVAQKIGNHLIDISFQGKNKDICWLDINVMGEKANDWNIAPVGCDLYNGISGIILFFVNLYKLTDEKKYFKVVEKCYASLKSYLNKRLDYNPLGKNILFGGYSGESPIIYSLLSLTTELEEHFSLKDVLPLCNIIINNLKDKIKQDKDYDILIGSAGLIIQLLNLYKITSDGSFLSLSQKVASYLMHSATQIDEKSIGWQSAIASNPLAGFAHGVSGLIWSLSQLYRIVPDEEYLNCIQKAINYETSLYNSEVRNWADRRLTKEGTSYEELKIMPVAWCHGAAGILLSRLLMKDIHMSTNVVKQINKDIEVALDTTIHRGFGRSHCLCHGDLGNIEILNIAAKKLNRPELYDITISYMSRIIDDMLLGDWKCGISYKDSPGVMLGLSGIGYGLLKLYDDSLNSILTLELGRNKNE